MPIASYTRRAIDKYQSTHKEQIKKYQKKYYFERKIYDMRMKEFKVFCNMRIF
jgi:hypothetical protein